MLNASTAFITRDRKQFLVVRERKRGYLESDFWKSLGGGWKPEDNYDPIAALQREALEEIGTHLLDIEPYKVVCTHNSNRDAVQVHIHLAQLPQNYVPRPLQEIVDVAYAVLPSPQPQLEIVWSHSGRKDTREQNITRGRAKILSELVEDGILQYTRLEDLQR